MKSVVKLGNCYVDPDSVEAIAPARDFLPGYVAFLASGRIVEIPDLTAEELEKKLGEM